MTGIRPWPWLSAFAVLLSGFSCSRPHSLGEPTAFSRAYHRNDPAALEIGRTSEQLSATHRQIRNSIRLTGSAAERTTDEDRKDDLEDQLEVLRYLDRRISHSLARGVDEDGALSLNIKAARILRQLSLEGSGQSPVHKMQAAVAGLVRTSIAPHRLPLLPVDEATANLSREEARLEAAFLYDSDTGSFLGWERLIGKSPLEVSKLDVSPNHPAWYRSGSRPENPVEHLEIMLQQGIRSVLLAEGKIRRSADWNLVDSRRVVFLEEAYKSATSAKCRVEDLFGVEWKMKWGDEVQSEPVSSHLYLMAGGRMTDLVYAGKSSDTLVVLAEAGKYDSSSARSGEEREPETVEHLASTLDEFYGFDVLPYIHSHGTIDRRLAEEIAGFAPAGSEITVRPNELLGRTWVRFREFSMELRPKGYIRRVDGSSATDLAANHDRVARGLYLFSLWLANRDAKNDNNKTFFVKRPVAGPGSRLMIDRHFDGHHDLGVTLGSVLSAGAINDLATGSSFIRRSLMGRSALVRETFVYFPTAYRSATWSDLRWMADRICGLREADLRAAARASGWPDFVMEALVFKLQARRAEIAAAFGVRDVEGARRTPPPDWVIDLSSPRNVRDAEAHYGLQGGSLAAALRAKYGELPSEAEVLLRGGQIVDSKESALINELVKQRYPAGLSDRYSRFANRHPEAFR